MSIHLLLILILSLKIESCEVSQCCFYNYFSWFIYTQIYFFNIFLFFFDPTVIINTFTTQHLSFEENNEPFLLENASNLTRGFLNDNFNKKILLNLLKLSYQSSFVKVLIINYSLWNNFSVSNFHCMLIKYNFICQDNKSRLCYSSRLWNIFTIILNFTMVV